MAERCNLCLSDYNRFFNNKYFQRHLKIALTFQIQNSPDMMLFYDIMSGDFLFVGFSFWQATLKINLEKIPFFLPSQVLSVHSDLCIPGTFALNL